MVTQRVWGQFTDLFQDENVRVKELIILPNSGISYQRHFRRDEIWFVSKGACKVKHSTGEPDEFNTYDLEKDEVFTVRIGEWHQIYNISEDPCHIIEIQYGEETNEEDIERLEYYDGSPSDN